MGVHSLWDIVGTAARPVKLEALSRKRLAVDASIWIYQFMKAVRDKEGNSLGQTHIVGFFRRICKMLYFGILPLFVFDGGAPPLKRQVIQARKERRQGNQENAANTAQKLLAMQMHRNISSGAPVKKNKTRQEMSKSASAEGGGENVYFDDLPMNHGEKAMVPTESSGNQPATFRRKDEYHLPELKQFTVRKGDQRIMPDGELEEYGEGQSWDIVDGISIDSVDPSSADFAELPMATQYMILSHLRLRSRLRLGYSKDQLENLFPNSHDFSKFQIQQVQKRNFYTQKLMTVSGMGEDTGNATRRIAGDKDRQYMLVKNDGGWTLSLGNNTNEDAIVLDDDDEAERSTTDFAIKTEVETEDSEDELLEDVPLENPANTDDQGLGLYQMKNDLEEDAINKAVIESIYDQYRHEFEDRSEDWQHEQVIQERIENLRDTDLRKAIEESKKDLFQKVRKEGDLSQNLGELRHDSEFEFGKSILFGGTETTQIQPKSITETHFRDSASSTDHVNPGDFPNYLDESEKEATKTQTNPLPLWFSDSSHLQSPHASVGFLSDKVENRAHDENEEVGLIPYSEARKYFKGTARTTSQISVSDNEMELDSDIQIIENIVEREPNITSSETAQTDETYKSTEGQPTIVEKPVLQQKRRSKKADAKKVFVQTRSRDSADALESKTPARLELKATSPQAEGVDNVESSFLLGVSDENCRLMDATYEGREQPKILDYDFDESEEEDLVKLLQEEEQEHAQFTTSIQLDKIPIHTKVSNEQLLQEQLQKAKRDAEEVTQTMINDVQELLKRFGIPYITAPMEAEAQCAELYQLGLVDGIVTDDSDCFLFGGSRIYRNMFNQKQYVECYIAEDIEHKVGLDQQKLIELALLLGSDYTEGVKGIGPVLAMEILAEFGGLSSFKQWFDETTKTLKKPDSGRLKLEKTLISRIKNGKLFLSDKFPDPVVVDAYKHPEVDHDNSKFKWGVPLLDQIRSFLMYNVGWSQGRVDEVMVPLIRNINKARTEGQQTTIGEFFPQDYISYKKDVGMGKRMKAAAERIRKV
ncbi:PIN domain-like protein [Metschnikowia bicuspidata var. bicuspidata NRRL YB-4993]|uniref:PIN domain-like protein n=1 Tax=Metschnikowia bicuspidata var. bicuspidata NRRL YB-4993 TaxID=869754 RepID=A0A1A0H5W5_9ASCO|nr:PIN domain-like protein [Metschnikowia bicuspidata var. bicuspidata NRRL YB-4993]OBA19308.1 PIN domain-like protein [Metschnikowia bicuspidata var. bicuspidata NRRL YB-4993]